MKSFTLNRRLILRTLLIVLVLALATRLVHGWQMRRHARSQLALAQEAEQVGDKEEAVGAFNRYLVFAPDDVGTRAHYGLTLAREANNTRARWRAMQVLRQVLAAQPGNDAVRLVVAELALQVNETAEARKLLEVLRDKSPDNLAVYPLLAQAHEANNNPAGAVETWRQAVKRAPRRVDWAVALADLLRDTMRQTKQAEHVMDDLVKRCPESGDAWLARARFRRRGKKLDAAAADLIQARKRNPRSVEILTAAAELECERGRLQKSCALWAEAIAVRPKDESLYLGLAAIRTEQDQPDLATQTLRRGLNQRPGSVVLAFALADVLIQQGELEEASRLIVALNKKLNAAHEHYLAARLLMQNKRWAEAVHEFKVALKAKGAGDELKGQIHLCLTRCHAAIGANDQRLRDAREAAKLNPRSPAVRVELGEALLATGRGDEAIPILRALARAPRPPKNAGLLLGRALLQYNARLPGYRRTWKELEEVIERAEAYPDQEVGAAILRAEVQWLRGDATEARAVLLRAQRLHPDNLVLYHALLELAEREGDPAAAERVLSQADRELKDRLDWQLLRTERVVRKGGTEAVRALAKLERFPVKAGSSDEEKLGRNLLVWYANMGKLADVERLAVKMIKSHPAELTPRLFLINVKVARRDDKSTESLLAGLQKLEGESGSQWRCARAWWLLNRAWRGNTSGLPEARKLLGEAIKARPTWSYPALLLARLDDQEKKPQEALRHYLRVLDLGDYQPLPLERALQLLLSEGRWKDADLVLQRAQARNAMPRGWQRGAAQVAVRAGRSLRARELALEAVPANSTSYRDLLWLGGILAEARLDTEAEAALLRATELAPDAVAPWLQLIAHRARTGRTKQAQAARDAMNESIAESRRPVALGQAAEALGDIAEARRSYHQALKKDKHDGEALQRLASLHLRFGEEKQAEPLLWRLFDRRVLIPEEQYSGIRRQLALVLSGSGRSDKDRQKARELLAINKKHDGETTADVCVLALVNRSLGDLEKIPGGAARLTPPEQFRLAQLYEQARQWTRTRQILQSLLSKDGNNSLYLATLVEVLLKNGKKAEATRWLERLEKVQPDEPRTKALRQMWKKPVKK